jgi:hypothetical protein
MQIHEITLVQEGILNTVGNDIKSAVTAPFKKAAAVLNTPGALTSAGGYATAMNNYYRDDNAKLQTQADQQKDARLAAQTAQRAKQLTQAWQQYLQSKKPMGKLKSAPTPISPTGKYARPATPAGQVVDPEPSALLPEGVGAPTPGELAAYQKKVAAAAAAAKPKTGFGALPGANPPPGNAVKPPVKPQKNIMTGSRANEFKAWVDQQLTSKVSGTNQIISMDQVRQDPATAQKLAQLLPTIIQKNDPKAIEEYLTIAMTTMQRLSNQIKQQQRSNASDPTATGGPISTLISPQSIASIKKIAQDPAMNNEIKKALGLR